MGKSIPFRVVATLFVGGEVGGDTELGLKGEIPVFLSSTFCVGCAEINASYSISGGGGKLPWLTRCLPSYTPCLSELFLCT